MLVLALEAKREALLKQVEQEEQGIEDGTCHLSVRLVLRTMDLRPVI